MKKIVYLFVFLHLSAFANPNIQILLNSPLEYKQPQNSCTSQACKPLLKAINDSKHSIDFAIYGMRNQTDILDALVQAQQRGVKIRGIVDKDIYNKNYYSSTDELIEKIGNIRSDYESDIRSSKKQSNYFRQYCNNPKGFKGPTQCVGYSIPNNKCIVSSMSSLKPIKFEGDIMHNKFFIFDNKAVWTGSTNISDSGTGGYNANIAILINNAKISNYYLQEFEQMYVHGKFHKEKSTFKNQILESHIDQTRVQLAFSPQSQVIVDKQIRSLLQNAKKYIDLPMFYLTHTKLTGDLIKAHQRGVKVRIIIDASAAQNEYSKHRLLRKIGIPVKISNWGGKMHMKVAVIDGKHLVTGSMNWTSAGQHKNDENILIIHGAKQAQQVHRFFNQLWDNIDDRWLTDTPIPNNQTSITKTDTDINNMNPGIIKRVFNYFNQLWNTLFKKQTKITPTEQIDNSDNKLPPFYIVEKADGNNLIKGIKLTSGKKIYIVPTHKNYAKYTINTAKGDQWLCSVQEAIEKGYKYQRK